MLLTTLLAFGTVGAITFDIPSIESYRYVSIREIEAKDGLTRISSSSTPQNPASETVDDYHVLEVKVKLKADSGYSTPSGWTDTTSFLVRKPAMFATSSSPTATAFTWPVSTLEDCLKISISPSSEVTFYVPFGSSATSASATISSTWAIYLKRTKTGDTPVEFTFIKGIAGTKYVCNDASIDSRRSYGQPNTEGALPGADANAPFRSVNFGTSRFKGGLFVGKTSGGPDRSRIARLQLWPQSIANLTGVKAACVSAFALNQPSGFTGSQTIGSYVPLTTSSYLSETETTATWEKAWTIDPHISSDPEEDDLTLCNYFAMDTVTIGTGNQQHIFSWNLTFPYPITDLVPTKLKDAVCLALGEEAASSNNIWRYFASREYISELPDASPYNAFPYSDARARVFLLTEP